MIHIVVLLLVGLMSGLPALAQDTLTFTTEAYPPYAYREADGTNRGAGIDQVTTMMADIDSPFRIEIMPWARAIALAETQPMHCVFAAARTPEREARFKWVLPLFVDRAILVTRQGSGLASLDMEAAKSRLVGTHRADYTEVLLEEMGFGSIDVSADFGTTVRKLIEGRIELMPMSESVFLEMLAKGMPLEKGVTLSTQPLGFACSLSLPDALITQLQAALDKLISTGAQDRILASYGVARPR
jgi:polar amino acid transport system substrate-binding protein